MILRRSSPPWPLRQKRYHNSPCTHVYTIFQRVYFRLENAKFKIFGTISFTPDLTYRIEDFFRFEFQHQLTAWIIEDYDSVVIGAGLDEGGIGGNGQSWMNRAAGHSNRFGR